MRLFCPINSKAYQIRVNEYMRKYPKDKVDQRWGYNLIGVYQSEHNTDNIPTVSQMKKLYDELERTNVNLRLVIPSYNEGTNKLKELPSGNIEYYKGYIRPSSKEDDNTVFVFGSNTKGIHGAGSAKVAVDKFGAEKGNPEGMQGNSYAIITKVLEKGERSVPLSEISKGIQKMYEEARNNPEKVFKIAYMSGPDVKTLNGYTGKEMATAFRNAGKIPRNVQFSEVWIDAGLITSDDYESADNDNIRYIKADEKGNITLYRLEGMDIEEQLSNFKDYLMFKSSEDFSDDENYNILESIIDKVDGLRSIDDLFTIIQLPKMAYNLLLWYQQSINYRNINNALKDTAKRKQIHKEALKEAIETLVAYTAKRGIEKSSNLNISHTEHIIPRESRHLELSRSMSSKERGYRVTKIARAFREVAEEIRLSFIDELEERLDDLRTKAASTNDYRITKAIAELEEDLALLSGENGTAKAVERIIHKEGLDEGVMYKVMDYFQDYIDSSDEECVEYEKLAGNKYIRVTLKREKPATYDLEIQAYVRRKKEAYQKIVDYFDILFPEAFSEIYGMTGLKFTRTIKDNPEKSTDEDGNTDNEVDEEVGEAYKDGYLVKARDVDHEKTLTKEVRELLSSLPMLDNTGHAVVDDLGDTVTMSSGNVYYMLLMESCKLNSVSEFGDEENPVKFLEYLINKKHYKWAKMIINRLKTEDGYDIRTLSKLYSCLRLGFIPYCYCRGDYMSSMNRYEGVSGALDLISARIASGVPLTKTAIYNDDGFPSENLDAVKKSWKEFKKEHPRLQLEIDTLLQEEAKKELKKIYDTIVDILGSIGIETDRAGVAQVFEDPDRIDYFEKEVMTAIDDILDNSSKAANSEKNIFDNNRNKYIKIVNNFGLVNGNGIKAMAYNAGKMKYSFSAPNYIDKLVKGLSQLAFMKKLGKDSEFTNEFNKVLAEEFQKDAFLYDEKKKRFRNTWLQWLKNETKMREKFTYIQMDSIDGKPYNDWDEEDIERAIQICWENKNEGTENTPSEYAYYHVPILSDSPAMLFVRSKKIVGEGFESRINDFLVEVVLQECSRIKRVRARGEKIRNGEDIEALQTYDMEFDSDRNVTWKGGAEFKFFPQLNSENDTFYHEINTLLSDGKLSEANKRIKARLSTLMEESFKESRIKNKEFYYNSVFATSQIIQLTTTDLAFYPNLIEFQKRFKQVYASGVRLNTKSKYGREFRRTITLKDQRLPSFQLQSLNEAIGKNARLSGIEVDFIKSNFNRINTTDAQALLSPKAFRAMLDMMGEWTDDMDVAFNHFIEGNWDIKDFMVIWQTLKPFMFTNRHLKTKVDEDSELMRAPLQYKDSEAMLTSFMGLVSGAYSESPVLNGMSEFMDKYNIDCFIFESGVKVGGHSKVDITHDSKKFEKALEKGGGKIKVGNVDIKVSNFESFVKEATKLIQNGKITEEEFHNAWKSFQFSSKTEVIKALENILDANPNTSSINEDKIDTVSYEDVMIAQSSSEHLVTADDATLGTQFANLILADLPVNFEIELGGRTFNRNEIRNLFQAVRVENILDGKDNLDYIFGSIENLRTHILKAIQNQKGVSSEDLIKALEIIEVEDPKTGKIVKSFNIPPHTPVIATQLNQMIMSVFKNKITKQFIHGGNATMISNFGLSDSLKIEKDKDGNILGIQCYLPAYSKDLYKALMDKDGRLDINKIKDPELLKVIGYRIPTEGKYSMLPLIVKGFLPQQMGSTIMLSSEIINMTGADFDIDKIYLITPNIRVKENIDFKSLREDVQRSNPEAFKRWDRGDITVAVLNEGTNFSGRWKAFEERLLRGETFDSGTPENYMASVYYANRDKYTKYSIEKVKYDYEKDPSEQSREARDNFILDMAFKTLVHPSVSPITFSSSSFKTVTRAASLAQVYLNKKILSGFIERFKTHKNNMSNEALCYETAMTLLKMSTEELDKIIEEYSDTPFPLSPTRFQESHKMYTTGGKMIGADAVSLSHMCKIQNTGVSLANNVAGLLSKKAHTEISEPLDSEGKRKSVNGAQYVAASVDDAKEDNLRHINHEMQNASLISLLTMTGLGPIEVSIILNNPSFMMSRRKEKNSKPIQFNIEVLLADTIHRVLFGKTLFNKEIIGSLYLIKQELMEQARDLKRQTKVYRADSPSAAALPSIGGVMLQNIRARILQNRMEMDKATILNGNVIDTEVNPLLDKETLREKLLKSKHPSLEAFFTLGISAPMYYLNKYTYGVSDDIYELLYMIVSTTGKLDIEDSTAEKIVKHAVLYRLSKLSIFGNEGNITAKEKREYYLKKFPDKLKKLKKGKLFKNNTFLESLIINRKEGITITSPSSLHDTTVSRIKRAVMELFNTEEGRRVAYDLMMYSFYKEGFQFTHNGISSYILNTDFITQFHEIGNALREMQFSEMTANEMDEFMDMVYKNIPLNNFSKYVNKRKFTLRRANNKIYRVIKISEVQNDLGEAPKIIESETSDPTKLSTSYFKLVDMEGDLCMYEITKSATESTIPNYVSTLGNIEEEEVLGNIREAVRSKKDDDIADSGDTLNTPEDEEADTESEYEDKYTVEDGQNELEEELCMSKMNKITKNAESGMDIPTGLKGILGGL